MNTKHCKQLLCWAAAMSHLLPQSAWAHAKWFADHDVTASPSNLSELLNLSFIGFGLLSVIGVFVAVYFESKFVALNQYVSKARQSIHQRLPHDWPLTLLRISLLVFFTSIWTIGDVILTPELKHNSLYVLALQTLVIIALVSKRTAYIASVGIMLLWSYGVWMYGAFHLTDYLIFVGIAVFVFMQSRGIHPLLSYGILYGSISATLQWGGIEKFAYPEWSFQILNAREYLTMGIPNEVFMNAAGFVEFPMAFLLLATSGISFVLIATGLTSIFLAAIIEFGKIDAIGHLAIIACLVLMLLKGPSPINRWFAQLGNQPVARATYTTLIYFTSLLGFFALYYSIRFVAV